MTATAGTLELRVLAVTNNPDSRAVQYARSDTDTPEYFSADPGATDDDVLSALQLLANNLNFQNQQDASLFGTTYVNAENGKVLTVTGSASHSDSNTIHYQISGSSDIQNYAASVTDTAEVIGEALQAIVDALHEGLVGTIIEAQ